MAKMLFRRKGWLGVGLSLVLCLALVASAVALGAAEGAEEGCHTCLACPIMRPDRETRERWIEAYNKAPRVHIDRQGFQFPSVAGSHSLLDYLDYTPAERNQDDCGNCWAWVGTGVMEIALSVQEGIKDRLSVQYINSCQGDIIGKPYCTAGREGDVADFYDPVTGYDPLSDGVGQCIPWSNANAHWQSGDGSLGPACGSISTTPNYPITAIQAQVVPTLPRDGVTDQATAIATIKSVLNQNKGVFFGFFLPDSAAWSNFKTFWGDGAESEVYEIDQFCGSPYDIYTGGGHVVLCVGYNDVDPDNSYWIMLNSWGTTTARPNGLFRINMDMYYQCMDDEYYNFEWYTLDVNFDLPSVPAITVDPPSFDVTLPPDTAHEYTLNIGNTGDADLTYGISVQETTVGAGAAMGRRLLSLESASRVREAPLERSQAEPQYSGQTQGGWHTIMTDSFEGAFPGDWELWVAPGATDSYWGKDGYRSYTGSHSAFCAKSGTAGVNPPSDYPNNMEAWMIYGPFSLEDATAAELDFWFWLDTEIDYDWFHWMASINGQYFHYGDGISGYRGGWVRESFDLSDVYTLGNLCGEPEVWIAFIFESDASTTYQGAFIDEVVLRKYVSDGVNSSPHTPSNPSPANHATHVSIDTDLTWTGGDPDAGDTLLYRIYFGASWPPPMKATLGPYPATQSSITYDPGTMSPNTKYYWQVVATDNHGASTAGIAWDFTTGGATADCPWLDEHPKSGSVAPGGNSVITVTVNTAGLTVGITYTAEIVIVNNDPDKNPTTVPVALRVSDSDNDVEPPNDFVDNPLIEEGMASIADDLVIVLLWQPATQTWDLYFPLTGDDTIGTLEAGRAYFIYVDGDCTLVYGTRVIELYAGWNNPAWMTQ